VQQTTPSRIMTTKDIVTIILAGLQLIVIVATVVIFGTKLTVSLDNTNEALAKLTILVNEINKWKGGTEIDMLLHKERNYDDINALNNTKLGPKITIKTGKARIRQQD
jgi:uncharacterized protein YoxC